MSGGREESCDDDGKAKADETARETSTRATEMEMGLDISPSSFVFSRKSMEEFELVAVRGEKRG